MRHFILSLSELIVGAILTIPPAIAAMTLPAQEWTMLRQVAAEYNPHHVSLLAKNVTAIIARPTRLHNGVLL